MVNGTMRAAVMAHIQKTYGDAPDFPWARYPEYTVFRHAENQKWYALLINVPAGKLGLAGTGRVDALNVKITDELLRDVLLHQPGYLPGYHMNRDRWMTVLLDGTVPQEQVFALLQKSHAATAGSAARHKARPPKEWLVPANPGYWDIEHAFDRVDEISWKQGSGIKAGDTVYMYVGAPVSAILYQCTVVKADIPYHYQDEALTIRALMQLKLVRR